MNNYIVILSIGPVQSMIASARRSRDLWSGSWLLSELAKACAKFFKDNGATLIFPYVNNDDDLQENSHFSVGNKIQVQVSATDKQELDKVICQAKEAVKKRLKDEVNKALAKLNPKDIRTDIWHAQIADFVEIQSAWARIDNDDYLSAVRLASKVLAARKATRDFNSSAHCPYQSELMIPKSSLDGLRETVLHENVEKQNNLTRKKLSLAPSEQLDAVGVIKRLGFGDKVEQFTPISRVMADAWINNLIKEGVDFTPIKEIFNKLAPNIVSKVTGNQGIYDKFPYDAQLLYKSRLEAEILNIKKSLDKEGDKDLTDALFELEDLKKLLNPLWQKYGQPYTYGALLLADGDRMGELLSKAQSLKQHQDITKALSKFAGNVAKTMRDYRGHCIYAGGDDVLGFVPLDRAYQCADKLQKEFAECLQEATDKLQKENQLSKNELTNPTLSVGLAICHIMTPMGIIRELAGQAEKYAKGDHIKKEDTQKAEDKGGINKQRNALGILLSVRGGSDIKVRFNWHDEIGLDTFKLFVKFYKDKAIPSRVAYDIRGIYLRTHQIAKDNHDLNTNIQLAELTRMLKQARTPTGEKLTQNTIDGLCHRGKKVGLDKLADELIVARWLAAKTQKELGKE
ncbi:MAG: type III-B CRISPR-associated protein Cas10/Cmr2 [Moraxella sp.]|nr:type III-B CRISPR-associated protein Cas10/Cmr2 [Moraxella sp.]